MRRGERGLSLLELVFMTSLLGLGIVMMIGVLPTSTSALRRANALHLATTRAESQLSLTRQRLATDPSFPSSDKFQEVVDGVSCTVSYQVTLVNQAGGYDLDDIVVQVTPDGGRPVTLSTRLTVRHS